MTGDVTYKELAVICGHRAYEALLVIENSAKIGATGQVVQFNCEQRLRRAFEAMRKSDLAFI